MTQWLNPPVALLRAIDATIPLETQHILAVNRV
jgi:hypothetical protein